MGWYWTEEPADPAAIRAEFCRSWQTGAPEGGRGEAGHRMEIRPEDSAWGSSGWYRTLWGVLRQDGEPVEIILWLVDRRKGGGGSWGYKPVEETMGPAEVDCPVRLLDVCPAPSAAEFGAVGGEWSAEWRLRVRAAHAAKLAAARAGAALLRRVKAGERPTVTLQRCAPLGGVAGVGGVELNGTTAVLREYRRGRYVAELHATGGWATIRPGQIAERNEE